tara:strand:+ start:368 stop:604 length:237 start_codon:yes stop_codon:yes gene_type:complete
MKHLELKIVATSLMLQELLDETVGDNRYKHKIRWHCTELTKLLEKLTDHEMLDNNVSLLVTDAINSLENSFDKVLEEV